MTPRSAARPRTARVRCGTPTHGAAISRGSPAKSRSPKVTGLSTRPTTAAASSIDVAASERSPAFTDRAGRPTTMQRSKTMTTGVATAAVDREELRRRISEKYRDVAVNPELGFHFHTGYPLTRMLGYPEGAIAALPAATVESFAGTGNPFLFGELQPGETVVDVGCGAGLDTLIAARQVGPVGRVISVDMTAEMREKAAAGARVLGLANVEV